MVEEANNQTKRKTVGQLSAELAKKTPDTRDPIALQRMAHKGYENHIYECVENSKKMYLGDFYAVVETKKEKLLPNVIRNFIFARSSCPTPNYDQTVYKYYRNDDHLAFLWVIPSKDTCQLFYANALTIVPEEKELLKFILDFYDGKLLKQAKAFNREEAGSNIIKRQ